MPIDSSCVGLPWSGSAVVCDTRWLMSFAAGIGASSDVHLDTARRDGIVAHPLFPVAPEWALLTGRDSRMPSSMTSAEVARGVHATHELSIIRPLRPDERVFLRPVVSGVVASRAGARVTVDIDALDDTGQPIWQTRMANVHLGVEVTGGDVPPPPRSGSGADEIEGRALGVAVGLVEIPIEATAALIYTECARIWNPIHTDPLAARAAGLAEPILHGTATLALGVQAVLDTLGAPPGSVVGVRGDFRAPVPMPSRLEVSMVDSGTSAGATRRTMSFGVDVIDDRDASRATAVRGGQVVLAV